MRRLPLKASRKMNSVSRDVYLLEEQTFMLIATRQVPETDLVTCSPVRDSSIVVEAKDAPRVFCVGKSRHA